MYIEHYIMVTHSLIVRFCTQQHRRCTWSAAHSNYMYRLRQARLTFHSTKLATSININNKKLRAKH